MKIENIRELAHAEPFKSFVIHLPDGRQVPVEHPDFVAFFPSGRSLVVLHQDDSESVIDPALVSDITVKGKGTPSSSRS